MFYYKEKSWLLSIKRTLYIYTFLLILVACSDNQTIATPEVNPHFFEKNLHLIWKNNGDYAYIDTTHIMINKNNSNTLHVYIFAARESYMTLIRNPKTGKFANMYTNSHTSFNQLKFMDIENNSTALKLWQTGTNQVQPKEVEKGKSGKKWFYADKTSSPDLSESIFCYVLPKIVIDKDSGYELLDCIILRESFLGFNYDLEKRVVNKTIYNPVWGAVKASDNKFIPLNDLDESILRYVKKMGKLK